MPSLPGTVFFVHLLYAYATIRGGRNQLCKIYAQMPIYLKVPNTPHFSLTAKANMPCYWFLESWLKVHPKALKGTEDNSGKWCQAGARRRFGNIYIRLENRVGIYIQDPYFEVSK